MKVNFKKTLLLFSTIFALIADLISVLAINQGLVDIESFNEGALSINSQTILLYSCTIINFISAILISKNLIKYKKKIIILNVIQLLLGSIINIVTGIFNIILIYKIKNNSENSENAAKKELPILEDITKHKWYVYLSIFVFLFLICYTPITNLLPINNKTVAIVFVILLYVIQITFLIVPMWNELKRDFIVFKNNFKLYLSNMLPRFGIIFIVYMFCNAFLIYFVSNISTNQALIAEWPIYISAFVAIIIAPLTEELMFRCFLKKFIKNDVVFIITSSLIFGALHVTVADSLAQFLFIIPYSILGFAFSLNYVKTRNIASNIFLHSVWNTLAVLAMILTKIL